MRRNEEIRKEIEKRRLKYFEVAEACGVSQYTFSHWLQVELKPEQKARVIKAIKGIKV